MKSFFVATAALFSVVSSFPLMPWEVLMTPPPAGTQFYTLQTKSYVSIRFLLVPSWLITVN
jgi:hypothetical protein